MASNLINRLQPFMRDSKVYKEIFESEETELTARTLAIEDLEKQLTVSTATWAIEIYENDLAIPIEPTKPIEDRRSIIKAKLRGVGKVDSELIKSVVSSWTGGAVDVNLISGAIEIKFIDTTGIPENISDVYLAIEEIKPAHLEVLYVFLYNTWLLISNFTWEELQAYTWEEVLSSSI